MHHHPSDKTHGRHCILLAVGLVIAAVLSAVSGVSAQSSDPGPGEVIAMIPMAGPQGLAVNTATNRIYVASDSSGTTGNGMWMIDGASLTSTQRFFLPADRIPFGVAVNSATNSVYVTNLSRSYPYNSGNIVALNEGTGSLTTIAVPAGVYLVAANRQTNRIYVTNNGLGSGQVTVIDGATNTLVGSPISVGSGPYGVAVNPTTNRIYVANNDSNSVSVIAGATNSVIATVPLPSGANPRGVAVNPTTNRIYVAMPLLGLVGVINGATNKLIATIETSSAPADAAANTNNRRVYATTYGGQEVDVIDGRNNQVLGGAFVGWNTQGVGVNTATNLIYVGLSFGGNAVAVIAECPLDGEGNFVCPP